MIRHATHAALAVVVVVSMAATPALAATPGATAEPRALSGAPALAQTTTETANGCTFPFTETDATGTEVTVDAPPERVVTVGGSASQTMWEIGDAREKVVALDEFSLYLENATDGRTLLTYEGSTQRLSDSSIDSIADADPDVVLAANIIADEDVQTLRNRGVTVYKFRAADSIEFIYGKTRLTGRLVDECDAADARTAELRQDVETIRRATADVPPTRVFYAFFGFTANRNTFVHDAIVAAGGENVAADLALDDEGGFYKYAPYTDQIEANDPEFFATTEGAVKLGSTAFETTFANTTAGDRDRNIVVNSNYISQPAPRVVIAMTQIVAALYPERYRQAQLGLLRTELNNDTDTGTWEIPYADADPLDSTVENDTAYLRVQNGDAPRTEFPVPDAFAANSTVRLTEVAVDTQEPNPIFTVTVRNATADAPALPGEARLLAAYETDTEDLHMFATNATYTLSVPLESVPGEPSELTVYRRADDGWAPAETTVRVNETTQTANVTASTDRLSAFAVGVAGGDGRNTVQSAPEPMAAYSQPTAVEPSGPTATALGPTAESSSRSVDGASGADDATTAPGAGVTPVVALTALFAAALLVGRRR